MLCLTPCPQISSGAVLSPMSSDYDLGDLEVAGEGVLMAGRAAGWPLGMPGACRPATLLSGPLRGPWDGPQNCGFWESLFHVNPRPCFYMKNCMHLGVHLGQILDPHPSSWRRLPDSSIQVWMLCIGFGYIWRYCLEKNLSNVPKCSQIVQADGHPT